MTRQREGSLSDAIRAALAHEPGLLLWRNSVGVLRSRGRVYHTGLGNGSADLVGVLAVEAPFTGPGKLGRFVALEVKTPDEVPTPEDVRRLRAKYPGWNGVPKGADRHLLEQEDWLASVRAAGGFACYVSSVNEARAAIARARTGSAS